MKSLKLMSLALVVVSMLSVTTVSAQSNKGGKKSSFSMVEVSVERMAQELDLTEDQAVKILSIKLKYADERETMIAEALALREAHKSDSDQEGQKRQMKMRQGQSESAKERQEQIANQQKAMAKEILAVLNSDQVVDYINLKVKIASRRSTMQQSRGGRSQMQMRSHNSANGKQQRAAKMNKQQRRAPKGDSETATKE